MKFWQHFIPHHHNEFHPTVLRLPGLALSLLLIAFLMLPTTGFTAEGQVLGYATNITVSDLHSLSNQSRTSRGLKAYRLNTQLNSAAAAKARHMFDKNYWAHNAPDGTTPWVFISASGYRYAVAGENLAKDFSTSAGVVNGWMNSSGHRANVLSSSFKDVGYAVVNGKLLGKTTTLVVAMYAAPVVTQAVKPSTTSKKTTATSVPTTNTTPKVTTSTPAPTAAKKKPTKKPAAKTPTPVPAQKTNQQEAFTNTSGEVLNEQSPPLGAPIEAYKGLTWQQRASIMILAYLILMLFLKHTLVWRRQKRGYRHIWMRAHPLIQASFLLVGVLLVFGTSAGVVL